MTTSVAIFWLATKMMPIVGIAAAFSWTAIPSPVGRMNAAAGLVTGRQCRGLRSYRENYYNGEPLFGNGDYYNRQGSQSSEGFRQVSKDDRYRRRESVRYGGGGRSSEYEANAGGLNGQYGRGYFRNGRVKDYYTPKQREVWQQQDNQGARYGWQQQYDTDRGNVRGGSSNNFRRGSAFDRIQDYLTPKQREIRQRQDNQGARYGWQQQYDTDRGNVRGGTSNDFRRGSALSRMQDYYTPKQREIWQRQDNQGARYGWQQQYDTGRGNVRGGSSSDFRRGSSFDRYQDFSTPREREMQQMLDNRELSRGYYNSQDYERDGARYGRDDFYDVRRS